MRIPICDVKALARKHNLSHCIVWGVSGVVSCVATYGHTLEQADEAADFGNRLKAQLGWPERLQHAEPSRVRRLKQEVKRLRAELKLRDMHPGMKGATRSHQ